MQYLVTSIADLFFEGRGWVRKDIFPHTFEHAVHRYDRQFLVLNAVASYGLLWIDCHEAVLLL